MGPGRRLSCKREPLLGSMLVDRRVPKKPRTIDTGPWTVHGAGSLGSSSLNGRPGLEGSWEGCSDQQKVWLLVLARLRK